MSKFLLAVVVLFCLISKSSFAQQKTPQVQTTFHIKSGGGWDYIFVDTASNKLYVSHGMQVNVLDKTTGDSLGVISHTNGVHGIAVVHSVNKGFTSNGRSNNVTVFDLKTLQVVDSIATGENPDAIFWDDYSNTIITCNGRSKNLSVIDPSTDKVVATIDVKGKPETAVSDGKGKVFINNEDKSEIEVVDITKHELIASWPIAPGTSPSGLAIDRSTKRLFAGCDNKLMMVIDATNGKVVAQVPIGDGCDGTAFNRNTKMAYSSNGEGTLTMVKETSKDKFDVVANVPTKRGARTCTVDTKTATVYLPTADFGTAAAGERRAPMIPGTFQILVVK
ncbi:MAG: YncE family protein [Bacteroidota bacterium]|nr:YncE family protein [Bacteroidota bacterium]